MDVSNYNYSYIFKFIIVGDMGVGKSSLMHMFINNKFSQDISHTIGVEFGTKVIDIEDQKIKLQIWDTAGQERFRAVTRSYYRGAAGVILVYDITRRSTFSSISNWLADAQTGSTKPVIFLIGNKSDLDNRDVTQEQGEEFARQHDILFLECSAKNGTCVQEAFLNTARKIYNSVLLSEYVKMLNNNLNTRMQPNSPDSGIQKKDTANGKIDLRTPESSSSNSCSC